MTYFPGTDIPLRPGRFIPVEGLPSEFKEATGNMEHATIPFFGASGDPEMEQKMFIVFLAAWQLWQERQRKYGRANIAKHGALGCAVRMSDKLARLDRYYVEGKRGEMPDETVLDSWLDVANYALMGAACLQKLWPGSPETR